MKNFVYVAKEMCSKSVIICLIAVYQVKNSIADACDDNRAEVPSGNVGQVQTFPWLGVIRVHLHEGKKLQIGLTGAILVKTAHAIAVADDIAKIPRKTFLMDSKAMFFSANKEPWYSRLKDYLLHPEYEYATFNTIALIELDTETVNDGTDSVPVLPICWPPYLFNASDHLYTLGYTDEKQLLEKMIHRVQYIDKGLCKEFYQRAGLKEYRHLPTFYLCGLAGTAEQCEWDNGMALASNSSGDWVLIGIGLKGPGCSSPSRFIEIYPYLQWIQSSTTNVEYDEYSYRRSAFGLGFKRTKHVPVQKLRDSNVTSTVKVSSINTTM